MKVNGSNIFDDASVLHSIYNGIVVIDTEGKIVHFNKTAERIFCIAGQDAIHRYISDVLPNPGGKLLECLSTGKSFRGNKLIVENSTLISNINPIIINEEIAGVISVFQDVSDIEPCTDELNRFENMENWLDVIIDSSYDGLWICDHEGNVIKINKASERINNIKAEEIVGKNMRDLVTEGLFDRAVTFEVLKKRTSVTIIQQIRGKKKILITGNPIFNDEGKIIFILANERDITELDNLRTQLQEAQALAKGYISKISKLEMKGIDFTNIIFKSEKMDKVIEMGLRVASVDSTVLISGESGVGKGAIAKFIHKHSDRSTGPFIRVDCAGIPDSLIESELYGYEKGAFTGAKSEGKRGFFELAANGTLFLDEIGEIPMYSQSKLLRFLDDHEIIRIGGVEPKKIDARVIAATNKNIEEMVSLKRFREDLYYRLNIVPIHIPPLRERRDDILPLIFHFIEKLNRTYGKKKTLAPEAIDVLCEYNYPGNIRELSNLIERLLVVTENDRIEASDLPSSLNGHISKTIPHLFLSETIPLRNVMKNFERILIERAVEKYGSQREAAKKLKVDQATISRKIKKYGAISDV